MKKGWNHEYFLYKIQQLKENLEIETDLKKKQKIEENIEVFELLGVTLLMSNGEIFDDELNFSEFVEEMYKEDFEYKIPKKELIVIDEMLSSLKKIPRLNVKKCNTHITLDDSIKIVGDYIKDKFDNNHYRLYEKTINGDYILFDKNDEPSSVTYLDGEFFLKIAKTFDIEMMSAIAHESGHIYRIVNNNNGNIDNYYKEYESFFYELNLLMWLIKNNIYKVEAINRFLTLFDTIEKNLIMRDFICRYKLNRINNPTEYRKVINELHIKKELHIRKDQDFFDMYSFALSTDILAYFNSFLAVLDNLDNFDKYEKLIRIINNKNEKDIRKKVLCKNRNQEFDSYMRYRNILQNQK